MPQSGNQAREMPLCNKPQSLDAQNLWLRNKFPLRSVSNVVRDNQLRRRAALKHHYQPSPQVHFYLSPAYCTTSWMDWVRVAEPDVAVTVRV